jgi:inner membrane protein
VIWKIGSIIFLTLLMLIPLGMIAGTIEERQSNRNSVQQEIAQTWAGEQTLLGPVLVVPYLYYEEIKDENGRKQKKQMQSYAYVLPEQYRVQSKLKPEIRYRGIFQATVYASDLFIEGKINPHTIDELGIPAKDIQWNKAYLLVNIPFTKGITRQPIIKWQGKPINLLPGTNNSSLMSSGLYTPVPIQAEKLQSIPFQMDLSLNGSQRISFVPIGKQNDFDMSSSWRSPSFIGNTLPTERTIDDKGFNATWQILYFSRSYGQAFTFNPDLLSQMQASSVGVELLSSVDYYRQAERAVKYGVLFIVLTFATYFIFEVISSYRLHPFQYFLVGCSLSLFYLLLIALVEVMGFVWAYTLASVATIASISLYSKAILGKIRKGASLMIAGLLGALYSYLYVLLQLEDLSLLFGTIGLFVVLGVLMYVTRNIDWYNEQPS